MMDSERVCSKCGESKPETEEFFRRRGDGFSGGLRPDCKECGRARDRARHKVMPTRDRRDYHRRAKKVAAAGVFTASDWLICLDLFNHECAYCGAGGQLFQDHVVPVSRFGSNGPENIVPACRSCNCSKQDRQWVEWYSTQGFFSEERAMQLTTYLGLAAA